MKLSDIKKNFGSLSKKYNLKEMKKLETSDLVGQEVTIEDGEIVGSDGKEFCIVTFKEYPGAYYFGGMVLTDLVRSILTDPEAYDDLQHDGMPIKLTIEKSKENHRNYTSVDIL